MTDPGQAKAEAAAAAAPPTEDMQNLQLDQESGEMVSKSECMYTFERRSEQNARA